MTGMEETWSPDPVKAWRYWRVTDLEWNWTDDRFEATLVGDREVWDGPVKYAGHHRELAPDFSSGSFKHQFVEVDHQSPSTGCLCGVNAVKELDWAVLRGRAFNNHDEGSYLSCTAVAPVELSGVVDEYEEGYRAEQATIVGPIRIFNGKQRQADALEEAYGVQVLVERWDSQWSQDLYLESQRREDGHRKADSPNHRGTGTGKGSRTGQRTTKGWEHFRHHAFEVGAFLLTVAAILAFVFLGGLAVAQVDEWVNGAEQDAECVSVADQTGGTALELGTFGDCQILLPNGIILWRSSIDWATYKSVPR